EYLSNAPCGFDVHPRKSGALEWTRAERRIDGLIRRKGQSDGCVQLYIQTRAERPRSVPCGERNRRPRSLEPRVAFYQQLTRAKFRRSSGRAHLRPFVALPVHLE